MRIGAEWPPRGTLSHVRGKALVHTATPQRRRIVGLLIPFLTLAFSLGFASPAHADSGYRYWSAWAQKDGAWVFATKAAAQLTPADGTVDGWRFQVSSAVAPAPRTALTFDQICADTAAVEGKKRVGLVLDFGRPVDAPDPAAEIPAPAAYCVLAEAKATSADILALAAEVREENSMTCGIAGYPAEGCGDPVAEVPAEATATEQPVDVAILPVGTAPGVGAPATTPATTAAATSAPATSASAGAAPTAAAAPSPSAASTATDDNASFPWGLLLAAVAVVALAVAAYVLNRRKPHPATPEAPRQTKVVLADEPTMTSDTTPQR